MFKHLFAAMHEALDHIAERYPHAPAAERQELDKQLSSLKAMSDACVEEWLLFEEKMSLQLPLASAGTATPAIPESAPPQAAEPPPPENGGHDATTREAFERAQGYYKLAMFDKAAAEFAGLAAIQPDSVLVRIYLAMCHLRLGNYSESYRLFQFLLPLTDNNKIKAIGYNAMGCIQAQNQNMEKAMEYFRKAYSTDPEAMAASVSAEPTQLGRW